MPETVAPPRPRTRLESVDVLRGVVMILMALDHVRDFFGGTVSPVNIAQTTAPLFFTRWITHFCAPVFFTLTGTGAYLAGRRRSVGDLSQFLIVRGVWLILLELTVLRCLGYQFNFDYRVTMLVILWALGWSMITLGLLVHLSVNVVTVIGVALIVAHNACDGVAPASFGVLAPLWTILHVPGFVTQNPNHA
ncbi:MAG TPA: heparan-alpha-glucosaminide N-acetyltransferase domain-containing protein, partial [Vicinamibacterales bacterium]